MIVATSPNTIESPPYLRRFKEKCEVIPLGIDRGFFYESGWENRGCCSTQRKLNALEKATHFLLNDPALREKYGKDAK